MKNKVLIIGLAILAGLLILETGYLMGLGTQRTINQTLMHQYRSLRPAECIYSDNDLRRKISIMQAKINRMFNDGFSDAKEVRMDPVQKRENFFVAATSTKNTDQSDVITINLQGFNKEDVSIEVKDKYLTVQAQQKKEEKVNNKYYSGQSQSAANFVQSIVLPDNADIAQISAKYDKNILTITIPKVKNTKKEQSAALKIPIN